ncbi:MAG: hypothetical protein QM813_12375 [Verrucomicrobiota bacterium]
MARTEATIRDDERIGVTNAGEEVEDAWIEHSGLEHGGVVATPGGLLK